MTTSRCPRTATTMTRVSTLLSHSKRILHFAAVRSIPLFCLLVVLVVHFVVLLIGSQCWPPAHKAQRNDLDVHTTNGDSGNVEMEPATAESVDAAESTDIAEIVRDVAESTNVCTEIATAAGNVRNLIKKFEVVEKPGTGAETDKPLESAVAIGYNGLDGSQKTSRVDQPSAGVVEQLIKRFDGSEKIPVLDDKPSQQVINKTSTVINLIDKFNCTTTVQNRV